MGRDDAPALGETHPGLHLTPHLAGRCIAVEKRGRHREVVAVCGDHNAVRSPGEVRGRAARAESLDRLEAVEGFTAAIAQGSRIVTEKTVEGFNIGCHERGFVTKEGGRNLRQYLWIIQFHLTLDQDLELALLQRLGAQAPPRLREQRLPAMAPQ